MAEETYDDNGFECPYCNFINNVECENLQDYPDGEDFNCGECDKVFHATIEFQPNFRAYPKDCKKGDCEFGEFNDWFLSDVSNKYVRGQSCNNCCQMNVESSEEIPADYKNQVNL